MPQCDGEIYIGTILLEPNRWKRRKSPSYAVSEWFERFEESGFDGIELWEYHATLCSPEELAKLERSPLPISIFNSYAAFDDAGAPAREESLRAVERFQARGVKFNLGGRWEERETYLRHLKAWARELPKGVRILCECHPGTIMEEPQRAYDLFARLETAEMEGLAFEAIVHPFYSEEGLLKQFFRLFGSRITHAHVQMREGGRFVCLDENPAFVKERLQFLQDEGFRGSFTLEFTAGTNTPDENRDALWAAAQRDLAFLREHWG